jgi:predicted small secreted protein
MAAGNLKRLAVVLGLSLALALTAGCNTLEGLGKDIQKAGDALEKSADGDD